MVGAVLVGIVALALSAVSSRDVKTRRVRYKGKLCTEYFDTKDGEPIRTECPSRGHEWYVDTDRSIDYPPEYPVTYATKPSNDR